MPGKTPYSESGKEANNTTELKDLLATGYRMDRPSDCPAAMCVLTQNVEVQRLKRILVGVGGGG